MEGKIIKYNPRLKELARKLRNNSTKSEVLLWKYLKGKQMRSYDFHRQKSIGNYIADFFCHRLMLVIEIDGVTHDYKVTSDEKRQKFLESLGIMVLRFSDEDVKKNINGVLIEIEEWIKEKELNYF